MSLTLKVIEDLKRMVLLTGRLSDVHVKTLRAAPFIFFDDLLEVEIEYDIATSMEAEGLTRQSWVEFRLTFGEEYSPDKVHEMRIQALSKTVENLLWKEVVVRIKDQTGKDLRDVKFNGTEEVSS